MDRVEAHFSNGETPTADGRDDAARLVGQAAADDLIRWLEARGSGTRYWAGVGRSLRSLRRSSSIFLTH
jgi:hypothetical protein